MSHLQLSGWDKYFLVTFGSIGAIAALAYYIWGTPLLLVYVGVCFLIIVFVLADAEED
jgi:hypothetical protein